MAIIKSYSPFLNLSNYSTFLVDVNPNSDYFRITEFKESFTGGKNGFLIEGSEYLKETTEIKIEILDVEGNPIYFEPGNGIPEYYEGLSKLVSVHIYGDTPIGIGKITILGELKNYIDSDGVLVPIPTEWQGAYNVKWEREFKINPNLLNEDIVRFYKRPTITIDEIVKPIFSKTIPSITQSGSLEGFPQTPIFGTDLTKWGAGTLYRLKITNDTNWTSSVDENVVNVVINTGRFDNDNNVIYDYYSPVVREVLNNKEVLVDTPYTINNIVSNFGTSSYTTSFEYVEDQIVTESALTGSFAKINIQQLKTFVGDVARVKVYRKSRNDIGDFQFVQESKLESTELLRDITAVATNEISYGNFTDSSLSTYWVSSSNNHPIDINAETLNASVKVDYNTSVGGVQQLITSESFNISKDVEYTISFKTLLSGSLDGQKTLKAYFSSSDYQQTFLTVSGSSIYKARQNVSQNIIASNTSNAKLVLEFTGDDWYVSNLSLKNAQETSFSPDEFVLVQEIPRNLATETYDFRFEFYDINNNYIPVNVNASKAFTGGNNFPTSAKILLLQSDKSAFRFTTGSFANPSFQQIGFTTTRQNIAGNVTFDRSVFDVTGGYINPTDYISLATTTYPTEPAKWVYPGEPHEPNNNGFVIQADEFSGSLDSNNTTNLIRVGFITYTASADGLEEYETIYRLEDGDNAPGIFASSTANQFIYKATDLSLNPSNQVITFDVRRKNLGVTGQTITINSGSDSGIAAPLTLLSNDPTTAVATYYLSGSTFNYTSGTATYFFSASDDYGIDYHDTIKITPIKILDGLSVNLSNENATLPAKSTGFVESGSFTLTNGSISVKVGNEAIAHNNGLTLNNRFDVISAIATNVQTGSLDYSSENYYITRLDADSGSLSLLIRYKDGAGDTTDITKVVTYTKAKKAAPVVVGLFSSDAQAVTKSKTGTYGTPTTFTISVNEGGSNYSYSNSGAINTFYVSAFTGADTPTNATITPTKPTTDAGTTTSITITYVNSEGTTGTITKTHRVSVTIDGNDGTDGTDGTDGEPGAQGGDGPGVVFRGPWSSTTTYNSISQDPTRRDVVLYSGTYYATKANATANLNKQPDNQPTFWESLGTDSFFVAAEMIISKESYVQNTINVGTNGSGNANITIAGGTTSPYISIGQATKGYDQLGAFIGSNGTTGRLSLKSASNSLTWDGAALTVTGAISGGTIAIGSSNSIFKADSNGIYLGNAAFASAPFSVTPAGVLKSTSGTIGGWTLGASSLTGGNATLASSGNITLGTSNDVVRLSADDATHRIWVGNSAAASAPFRVTKAGALTASGVSISGDITATSGTFTGAVFASSGTFTGAIFANTGTFNGTLSGNTGNIGGWTIDTSKIYIPSAITLDAGASKSITLYDSSNVARVFLRQSNTFATLTGGATVGPISESEINNTGTYNPGNFDRTSSSTFVATSGKTINISATFTTANGTNALTITTGVPNTIDCWSEIFIRNTTTNVSTLLLSYKDGVTFGTSVNWAAINNKTAQITINGDGNTYEVYQRFRWTYQGTTFFSASNYRHPAYNWTASPANSFVEIIAGGIQVGRDSSNYVKMDRAAGSGTMLEVGGSITATGNITAFLSSDERLKENIIPISNALDKLDKIEGVEFDWTDEFIETESGGKGVDGFHFRKHDVGIIAQQIKEVLPEVVAERPDGYLAVKYDKIIPLLIQCIKELKEEVIELKRGK